MVVLLEKKHVNKVNRVKHLEYAQFYREKPLGYWNTVMWSNESKFNLFGSDGKVIVWRTRDEEFSPSCIVPTVKYGGGSVKCWVCFPSSGAGNLVFIDGTMNAEVYRDILENNLLTSVKKLGMTQQWIFQQDNDPKHTAAIVTNWLNKNGIERFKWSSFSPDMNPIEY